MGSSGVLIARRGPFAGDARRLVSPGASSTRPRDAARLASFQAFQRCDANAPGAVLLEDGAEAKRVRLAELLRLAPASDGTHVGAVRPAPAADRAQVREPGLADRIRGRRAEVEVVEEGVAAPLGDVA